MTDAETRLEKYLPEILRWLRCNNGKRDEVTEFLRWLCHEFPEVEKHYNAAPSKKDVRENLTDAAEHASELVRLISAPLVMGAVRKQAIIDALSNGKACPSWREVSKLEDSLRTLATYFQHAVDGLDHDDRGDHKKLGGYTPKQWIIIMCAELFQGCGERAPSNKDREFLAIVDSVWTVVTGEERVLTRAVRDTLPEFEQQQTAESEALIAAAKANAGNTSDTENQERDIHKKTPRRVIPLKK